MGFVVDTTGTTLDMRWKVTPIMFGDEYIQTRAFMKFNITTPPFTLAEIDSVVLKVYYTRVSATKNTRLRSSIASGWGATLDATLGDWNSTATNIEDTISVASTGYQEYDVDKNNLNLSGYTYFRMTIEESGTQALLQFASQNHGTSAYRPQLIVTWTAAATGKTQVCIFG